MPLSEIEEIVAKNPESIVIVDEAYVDFGAASALPLIEKYDNLLVVQTFSKSRSLAGMRIGYAFGNPELIKYLNDVKYSFNSYTMDRTTIAAGVASMRIRHILRNAAIRSLQQESGQRQSSGSLDFPSRIPDPTLSLPHMRAVRPKSFSTALREKHIYVRYFPKDRIDNHLRITIGTDEEMKKLVEFLTEYLQK